MCSCGHRCAPVRSHHFACKFEARMAAETGVGKSGEGGGGVGARRRVQGKGQSERGEWAGGAGGGEKDGAMMGQQAPCLYAHLQAN